MVYATPRTINDIYLQCLLKRHEEYEESITVAGLISGTHCFHKERLESAFLKVLSGVKGLPAGMRYSASKSGMPWVCARGKESRYSGITLEAMERLLVMAIGLGMARIVPHPEIPCDLPYIVIDDSRMRRAEMMQPRAARRNSVLEWRDRNGKQ